MDASSLSYHHNTQNATLRSRSLSDNTTATDGGGPGDDRMRSRRTVVLGAAARAEHSSSRREALSPREVATNRAVRAKCVALVHLAPRE